MSIRLPALAAGVFLAINIVPFADSASAMPLADALAIKNAAATSVESVQWRRGWGWGLGAGIVGGAIVGGMIANPYYGPGPYYTAPVVVAPPPGDAVAYCMQRYKSYDPGSGTFLGYDGFRHPCP
jgi:hypothetical protein